METKVSEPEKQPVFVCEFCGKKFADPEQFVLHVSAEHYY